jgi:hypothetical protein
MKGWTIFLHSVRMVIGNFETAMRVSLVPYAVHAILGAMVTMRMPPPEALADPELFASALTGDLMLLALASTIASVVCTVWIAVAWHRYVLIGEDSTGWLPRWDGGNVLGYFGRSMLLGLVVVGAIVPLSLLVATLGGVLGAFAMPLVVAGGVFAVLYRFGLILPARAMGRDMALLESWNATRDTGGTIASLVLVTIAMTLLVQVPTVVSGNAQSLLSVIYSAITGWFVLMIGTSILTSLYGHYVEGRDI